MAKKKAAEGPEKVNLRGVILKGPHITMKLLQKNTKELKYTKVIQTYVLENNLLKLAVFKGGKPSDLKGYVKWIGNQPGSVEGTEICIQVGNEIKTLRPTKQNTKRIAYDTEKSIIAIEADSSVRCGICGKNIEIDDEAVSCPLCGTLFHQPHLDEYVKSQNECYACKKKLELKNGLPVPID